MNTELSKGVIMDINNSVRLLLLDRSKMSNVNCKICILDMRHIEVNVIDPINMLEMIFSHTAKQMSGGNVDTIGLSDISIILDNIDMFIADTSSHVDAYMNISQTDSWPYINKLTSIEQMVSNINKIYFNIKAMISNVASIKYEEILEIIFICWVDAKKTTAMFLITSKK